MVIGMTLTNRRALVLWYGVSLRLISRLLSMFQVVMTTTLCQRMSGSKDVPVTKVIHPSFRGEILLMTMLSLIAWKSYSMIV